MKYELKVIGQWLKWLFTIEPNERGYRPTKPLTSPPPPSDSKEFSNKDIHGLWNETAKLWMNDYHGRPILSDNLDYLHVRLTTIQHNQETIVVKSIKGFRVS